MPNQGLLIGSMATGRPSIGRSLAALFDPRVPSREACEPFLGVFKRSRAVSVRVPYIHAIAIAPPGAGKSTGLAIPHLLTCRDSCVVVDMKGELARATARARSAMRQRVVLLDPYKKVTQSPEKFNPLQHIDPTAPDAIDSCRDLGEALVVRTGMEHEPHFNEAAEMMIASMAAAVVAFSSEHGSLQTVKELITTPDLREKILKVMQESGVWGGALSRMGHALSNFRDKELSSVLTTAARHLRFLDTPLIAESIATNSSFNPAELVNGRMTIYLIIPPEHLRAQAALLRVWIGSLLRVVVKGGQP